MKILPVLLLIAAALTAAPSHACDGCHRQGPIPLSDTLRVFSHWLEGRSIAFHEAETSATLDRLTVQLQYGDEPRETAALLLWPPAGSEDVNAEERAARRVALGTALEERPTANRSDRWMERTIASWLKDPAQLPEDMPDFLLAQFQDDDIPGNGLGAMLWYAEGLRRDARGFAIALDRRLRRLSATKLIPTQESLILSALWMEHRMVGMRERENLAFPASLHGFTWYPDWEMIARDWNAADHELAEKLAATWWQRSLEYDQRDWLSLAGSVRDWSWYYLEQRPDPPTGVYRAILNSESWYSRERRRAQLLWYLRDPESLFQPELADEFVRHATEGWLGFPIHTIHLMPKASHEDNREALSWEIYRCAYGSAQMVPVNWMDRQKVDAALLGAAVRWVETHPQATWYQLSHAIHFLVDIGRESHQRFVLPYLYVNLLHDEEMSNANESYYLLNDLSGVLDDSLEAAWNQAIEMADFQMIHHLAMLRHHIHGVSPCADPRAMAIMLEQFRNDDIPGNATSARYFFESCDQRDLIPLFRAALEGADRQKRVYLERLLEEARSPERP